MKVIEILNKIANGEEVPKKIKYLTSVYTLRSNGNYYIENENSKFINGLYYQMIGSHRLNDEVEIIEDKKIRKICTFPGLDDDDYAYEDGDRPNNVKINNMMEQLLINKINEIIDKINKE